MYITVLNIFRDHRDIWFNRELRRIQNTIDEEKRLYEIKSKEPQLNLPFSSIMDMGN